MVDIRIQDLPTASPPVSTDVVAIDSSVGGSTRKTDLQTLIDTGRPLASQTEAEGGTNPTKAMTPLTTKQAVDFYGLTKAGNLAGLADLPTSRSNLGVAIGSNVQGYDPALASIAGLTTAADQMIYTTASDVYATTALTPFARTMLDDADASTVRTTIGLGNSATLNVGTTPGTVAAGDDSRIVNAVQTSRVITAGTGLTGGGDLSADRTLAVDTAFLDANYSPLTFTPDVPSPLPRPIVAKIKDGPISLEDCGYVSGNALAALNKALASGNPLLLGPKTYEVDGLSDVVTNTPVHIEGYGFGRSILKFIGATAGLRISQNTYINPTIIKDVLLTTTQQEPGTALSVTYSSADSIGNRNLPRCNLIDVSAYGHDIMSHGWTKGIVLTDVHRPSIVRPIITGRRNLPAGGIAQYLNMVTGIEIIGTYPPTLTAVPSDILIENPRLDQMSLGIKSSGEVEGLLVNTPVIVAVGSGVTADYATGRPWVKVCGGHMNIFDFGVNLKNAPQSTISDMLIYKFQDTTGDTYAINMDACDDSSVANNTLYNLADDAVIDGEWNGVNIINSTGCKIDNIRHINPSKTVILGGTTTGTETSGLSTRGTFTGATVQIYDDTSSGTNEVSGDNKPISNVSNGGVVNLASDTPGAITQTVTLNVNKGERYLVDGMVVAVKVGAAGEFLTQLATTGTATTRFGNNRATIMERSPQAASSTIAHSVSGILTVDATGTLVVQIVGTSTGSGSTIFPNDGQLSVVLL